MESAMMLIKIFGPLLAIIGLWMLLYGDNYMKIITSIKSSPHAIHGSGVFFLLLGLVIINTYNMWQWNIFLFLTLLGWFFFLRGLLTLFMPQLIVRAFFTKTSWIKTSGIIPFVWGLILTWIGFYM